MTAHDQSTRSPAWPPVAARALQATAALLPLALLGCEQLPASRGQQLGAAGGSAVTSAALGVAPEPDCTVATFGGHEYWFCRQNKSWSAARTQCQARGQDLARIDSAAENAFVFDNLPADAWLGARDQTVEGAWRWADNNAQFWSGGPGGTPVGGLYRNWRLLQPDNLLNQDCGAIETLLGQWSDRSCTESLDYVCERALDPGEPVIGCNPAPADAPWPAFRRCATHQAGSGVQGALAAEPVASYATGGAVESSPVVAADGTIYVGSSDNQLYALNADLTLKWRFQTQGALRAAPAIGADGTIYVGSSDRKLYAIRPDGTQRWSYTTGGAIRSAPAVAPDGTIYVGSDDSKLYALTAAGAQRWNVDTNAVVRSSPAISPDGTVYFGSDDWRLFAVLPTGAVKWTFTAIGPVTSSPAIAPDGTIYVGSFDGRLYALNPGSGRVKWSYSTGQPVTSSPAVAPDGSVVFGDNIGRVRAVRPDGTLKWQFATGGQVLSSPALGVDGVVYVGSGDDAVYALAASNGAQLWRRATAGDVISSPAIGERGTIYVGSSDRSLYAIGGSCESDDATCDGLDDDCDGSNDEDFAGQATSCGTGACAATGSTVCVAGAVQDSCTPGTPAANDASCNNVDDDCNGTRDEDFAPQATSCGTGACARTGSTSCVAGAVQDSCTPGTPAANDASCNNVDDDCSGARDEDFVGMATSCGTGACARTGSTSCVAGAVQNSCTPGTPAANDASCNGIDDDCSGAADEDYATSATTCQRPGCIASGTLRCVAGTPVDDCASAGMCVTETDCDDAVDNDADAATDCADADCATVPPCGTRPEICGNTVDDDADGLFDCADPDCALDAACSDPPPSPEDVAPPLDPAIPTSFHESTHFIYAGPSPVQFFMEPETIEPERTALIRGSVRDTADAALGGVRVTVLDHPEFGESRTDVHGSFAMVVNGGGTLVLRFEASGFLAVDRRVSPSWEEAVVADDVVLTALDPVVTTVELDGSSPPQMARGSLVTDEDGSRQPTVLFPPNVGAQMVMADGSVAPLPSASVRATELTVGDNGREAMAAPLPANTAYTHMLELSVDEALTAGAVSVEFSQPLVFYNHNFIGAPVGSGVPAGFYDRERGEWVASANGRVIAILSESAGQASIDVTGSGAAATAAELGALGVTADELSRLAALYAPGDTLWRVRMTHFTPWDCNWPYGPPDDAGFPPDNGTGSGGGGGGGGGGDDDRRTRDEDDDSDAEEDTRCDGSQIGCFNQTLGEDIPIAGTPYRLHYESSKQVPAGRFIRVNVTGQQVPASVQQIVLKVEVAGRSLEQSFPTAPNQTYDFEFDGNDSFGRKLRGAQRADLALCYTFPVVYYSTPAAQQQSFGSMQGGGAGAVTFAARERMAIEYCRTWSDEVFLGKIGQVGGWDVNVHHAYDSLGQSVYTGDGGIQTGKRLWTPTRTFLDGNPNGCPSLYACGIDEVENPNGAANLLFLWADHHLVAPDGTAFFVESALNVDSLGGSDYIVRVRPNGASTRIIGTPTFNPGLTVPPPTLPGTQFRFVAIVRGNTFPSEIRDIALGPDGRIYVLAVHTGNLALAAATYVYSFNQDGSDPRPVAGDITPNSTRPDADGMQATAIRIPGNAQQMVFGPDGALYIAESHRVRRIGTDGIITTVAGQPVASSTFDPGTTPIDIRGGTDTRFVRALGFNFGDDLTDIAVGPTGETFLAVQRAGVMVIGTDGILRLLAGGGPWVTPDPDLYAPIPGPANLFASRLVLGRSGEVYLLAFIGGGASVYRIANGALVKVAGEGGVPFFGSPFIEEQSSERIINNGGGIGIHPDGDLLVADRARHNVMKVEFNGFAAARGLVPSADGSQWWEFVGGRHHRTLDAGTGAPLLTFSYDPEGRLIGIQDGDGNLTAIERDGAGNPTAIRPPFAPPTVLMIDAGERLDRATAPDGGVYDLAYFGSGSMLRTFTTPNVQSSTFDFDSELRLRSDTDAAGGVQTLVRTDTPDSFEVTRTVTGITNPWRYREELQLEGALTREFVLPDATRLTTSVTGMGWVTTTQPDGTFAEVKHQPDPVLGMANPVPYETTIRLPSGLTRIDRETRTATLGDRLDPLTLQSREIRRNVGTRGPFIASFDAATRTYTHVTPVGREVVTTVDALGRPTRIEAPGLHPLQIAYDSQGRPGTITTGTGADARQRTFAYRASDGYLESVSGPLASQVTTLVPDASGRPLTITSAGAQLAMAYDAMGNPTSLTPPGGSPHGFTYTPLNLIDTATTPAAAAGDPPAVSDYDYTPARKLDQVTLPGGRSIDYQYHPATGKLMGAVTGATTYAYTYAPATGQLQQVTSSDELGQHTLALTHDGEFLNTATWGGGAGLVQGSVRFVKDNDFLVDRVQVNGSDIVDYGYDADGLLRSASAMTLARSPDNVLLQGTTLGAMTTSEAATPFGELASATAAFSGTTYFAENVGERDGVGRIRQLGRTAFDGAASSSVQLGYEYDALGRLQRILRDGVQASRYEWTANGDRTTHETALGTVRARYDQAGRLTRYCPESGSGDAAPVAGLPCFSYGYLASGELRQKTDLASSGTTTYDYDELGALRTVELQDGRLVEYEIDPTGRRVGKRVDGVKQWGLLYLDELRPVAQLDAGNALVSSFVYATRTHVPDYLVRGGQTYRLVSDHLGSVRLVVRVSDGVIVQRLEYDEFGAVLLDTNPGFQPFGFAGGVYDPDTGLVRFGARDYDPVTGRWTAADPIGFEGGTSNLYEYCGNDPLNCIDPEGLDALQNVADFSAGLGDALLLGFGDELRDAFGVEGVDRCSTAYSAGSWASFAVGVGRLGYAAAAKGISLAASSGAAASVGRQQLKSAFRLGVGRNWRPPNLAGKSDEALRASAGRTNPWINGYGAGVTGAGAAGATDPCGECD